MGRGGGALPQASRTGHVRRGRVKIEEGIPLARMTTVGIGGPARALARPATLAELEEALAWAGEQGLDVRPIGLGSNLLARRRRRGRARRPARGRARSGRGARRRCSSPAAAHRMPSASIAPAPPGSAGFEFACAIPGTAGGGVRMNAGAYGSDWKAILVRALVVDADRRPLAHQRGARPLVPPLCPRPRSGRRAGRVPARRPRRPPRSRRPSPPCRRGGRTTQPTNKRTFGSVFKNPDHELGAGRMIEQCGLKGHRIGGATDLATPCETSSRTPAARPPAMRSRSWPRPGARARSSSGW